MSIRPIWFQAPDTTLNDGLILGLRTNGSTEEGRPQSIPKRTPDPLRFPPLHPSSHLPHLEIATS